MPVTTSLFFLCCGDLQFMLGAEARQQDRRGVFVEASGVMGPRRKACKLQPVGGSGVGEPVSRPSEPKDYINELSHEVLCHIFRYYAL